eukprot:TRINITY_DN8255_c0_g2_i1.p1 TRINITY_DN8255_c0_g2~~TRINITY_DN8255_c0_g2_i1.p1  ORF type:complete len:387 (-),score=6.77 TRINITY_DN8255_c0_g2_i1:301-1461(-)
MEEELGEGFIGSPIWAVVGARSNPPSDDEDDAEALSFCDLAIYADNDDCSWRGDTARGNASEDVDFEFSSFGSQVCSAEELFYKGRLLPLVPKKKPPEMEAARQCDFEYDLSFRKSYSCKENRAMPAEKVQAWRMNSLDSLTSRGYKNGSGSVIARRSVTGEPDFMFPRKSEKVAGNISRQPAKAHKSSARSNCASTSASSPSQSAKASKSSLKWQFFTLGLMKTPPIRLEDIRQRQSQARPSRERLGPEPVGSVLRRSVSCSSQDDVASPARSVKRCAETKAAAPSGLKLKAKSVKENIGGLEHETPRSSKAWRMLKPLSALNGCRASSNSVINCSSVKKTSFDAFTTQINNNNTHNNNTKLVAFEEPHRHSSALRPPPFCKISA